MNTQEELNYRRGVNYMGDMAYEISSNGDYRNLVDNSEIAVLMVDPEGYYLYVNVLAAKLYGFKPEEMIGMRLHQHVDELKAERIMADISRVIQGNCSITSESSVMVKGEKQWFRINLHPARNEKGQIFAVSINTVNITEAKLAEERFRESELKYRTLFTDSPVAYLILDKGRIIECNKAAEILAAREKKEMLGRTPSELSPEYQPNGKKSSDYYAEMAYEAFDNRKATFEWLFKKPDGAEALATVYANVIEYEGRQVLFSTCIDISEKRKTEEALQISEKRYKHAAEHSRTVIWEVDKTGLYTYVNNVAQVVYGYSPDELIGKKYFYDLHPEEVKVALKHMGEELIRNGKPINSFDNHLIRKDGRLIWVSSNAGPIYDMDNNIAGYRGSDNDITERKMAEQDCVARAAAEEANRAKSVFLSSMSHEIRTPMNAIVGFAQILNRDTSLAPKQAEHVRSILRSSEHLIGLINDILDLSRIEAGYTSLNNTAFSLPELMDDLLRMFCLRASEKELQLYIDGREGLPEYVIADEAKLRQVLINLIGNAIKFTSKGGVGVRFSAKNTDSEDMMELTVKVEDTGAGISEEDKKKIFNSFWQTEEGHKAGGTGLGLAISKNLIELMGGRLTVEDGKEVGSIFRLCIPVKVCGKPKNKQTNMFENVMGLEPDSGPFRILIVDDIKENRDLLLHMLEPFGFELMEAADGKKALGILQSWSPHCILVDINMPVMDGYETVRKIKSDDKGEAALVIVVSSSAFDGDVERVMLSGADDLLSKPFRVEELLSLLGKIPGLKYVFRKDLSGDGGKTESNRLNREKLDTLPEALVHLMRQAVFQGNMMKLRELIKQVEKVDAGMAQGLHELARQYDYETLGKLFERRRG